MSRHIGFRKRVAGFDKQSKALLLQKWSLQRRAWGTNASLLLTPVFFLLVLFALRLSINRQLDNLQEFQCGCRCLTCCAPNGTSEGECRQASDDFECPLDWKCLERDEDECGFEYSTLQQSAYCPIKQTVPWTPLIYVPYPDQRAQENCPAEEEDVLSVFYTGNNKTMADTLMQSIFVSQTQFSTFLQLSKQLEDDPFFQIINGQNDTGFCSLESTGVSDLDNITTNVLSTLATLQSLGFSYGVPLTYTDSLLYDLAFSAAFQSLSNDTWIPTQSLYYMSEDCDAFDEEQQGILDQIGCLVQVVLGMNLTCAPVEQKWKRFSDINQAIYCAWEQSGCAYCDGEVTSKGRGEWNSTRSFIGSLFDWKDTNSEGLDLDMWVQNSQIQTHTTGYARTQRWNEPMNIAANAFFRMISGNDATVSVNLLGLKDMPRGGYKLNLDWSTLLGPLFFVWIMQLPLVVNTYQLMYEKEKGLKELMRAQGLSEAAYIFSDYIWYVFIYGLFYGLLIGMGYVVDFAIITENNVFLLILFFALTALVNMSWAHWNQKFFRTVKFAVLTVIMWIIIMGIFANLVLDAIIKNGPMWVAYVMEVHPSFGGYRGMYEFAQYGFLAQMTSGSGLNFVNLEDDNNHMIYVLILFAVEFVVLTLMGWRVAVNGQIFPKKQYKVAAVEDNQKATQNKLLQKQILKDIEMTWKSNPGNKVPAFDEKVYQVGEYNVRCGNANNLRQRLVNKSKPIVLGGQPLKRNDSSSEDDGCGDSEGGGYYGRFGGQMIMDENKTVNYHFPEYDQMGTKIDVDEKDSESSCNEICEIEVENSQAEIAARKNTMDVEEQIDRSRRTDSRPNGVPAFEGESYDVYQERLRVQQCLESNIAEREHTNAVIINGLSVRYEGSIKYAVDKLSLMVGEKECFGLLGPNGAGKTTTFKVLQGTQEASAGQVIVAGVDVLQDKQHLQGLIGVCPQFDVLWDDMTGKEHLMFYGRLRNLEGAELQEAVMSVLVRVNLDSPQVCNSRVKTYSGGMKRRLSLAISLIGDPKVVFLDEPSTGLDPGSRRQLWDIIKAEKQRRSIVLTTHSMEEAEMLCDRMGVFVEGKLRCIGNAQELKAQHGGFLQFQFTCGPTQVSKVIMALQDFCPRALSVSQTGSVYRFELPTECVRTEDVYLWMEKLIKHKKVQISNWSISNATLENVFLNVAGAAGVALNN